MCEVAAHADERASRLQRLAQDLEQLRPLLERRDDAAIQEKFLVGDLVDETGSVADEQSLLGIGELDEHGPDHGQKRSLRAGDRFVVQLPPQVSATKPDADESLVEILARPVREPGVDH